MKPVAAELVKRGSAFSGLLYAGLAMTSRGPAVVEFNCRFGDPETQSVLALLDSPLGQLLHAAATGSLAENPPLRWRDGAAVTVVLAAENYPGRPRVGDVIVGTEADGVLHAGTVRRDDGAVVSSGGRVLSVVGTGARSDGRPRGRLRPDEVDPVARQPLSQRHRTRRGRRPDQGSAGLDAQAVKSGAIHSSSAGSCELQNPPSCPPGEKPPEGGFGSWAMNCWVAE